MFLCKETGFVVFILVFEKWASRRLNHPTTLINGAPLCRARNFQPGSYRTNAVADGTPFECVGASRTRPQNIITREGLDTPLLKNYPPNKNFTVATTSNSFAITPNSKRNLELDLDYLEKRQNEGNTNEKQQENLQSPIEISPESVDRVKVILLGAPAVGKTSIIQQFVWNDFCEDYQPTDQKHTYYPSVITNDRLYEIKISDLPVIPYFPVNSYYEWTDFRFYGLRSATAYVLVFDLSNLETFQYIKSLRDQICESRNMSNVPILVIGNKQDLIAKEEPSTSTSSKAITGSPEEKRRDINNLVKKHWKCGYVECSAKYNWKVVAAFKELINMIDSMEIRDQSPILDNLQEALDRNKCAIL